MKIALVLKIVLLFECSRCSAAGHLEQGQGSSTSYSESLRTSYNGDTSLASSECSLNTIDSCPPWFYCQSGKCQRGPPLGGDILVDKKKIADGYCVTYNELEDSSEIGKCNFNSVNISTESGLQDNIYNELPNNVSELNAMFCDKFNRQGTLCAWSVQR